MAMREDHILQDQAPAVIIDNRVLSWPSGKLLWVSDEESYGHAKKLECEIGKMRGKTRRWRKPEGFPNHTT